MSGRGIRGGVLLVVTTLLGCGGARPLDLAAGSAGSGGGASGQAGPSGQAGATGGGGAAAGAGGDPTPPDGTVTPRPPECGCAPGAGIDLLACGSDWLPNTLRDAPEAVVTPDGATVVFNRCIANAAGGCRPGVFRWVRGAGVVNTVPDAWVFAVSADGLTTLAARFDGDAPFLMGADGATRDLPLTRAYARLLSADGNVVVARAETSIGITEVVRWTAAGTMALGDLAGGPTYSEPTAINAGASVIVGYGNTVRGQEPFLWTQASGMTGLGILPSQVVQTVARAASADGTVVVGSGLSDTGNAIFRWTLSGGMQGIAYIFSNVPLGGPMSYFSVWSPPLLVSSDGAVVAGTAAQPSNPVVPFALPVDPVGRARAALIRARQHRARRQRRRPADCRKYAGVGRAARDAVCVAALPGVPVRGRNRHAPTRGCACRLRSGWYDARRSHCDIRRRQHPGWSCDVRRHGGHFSRVAAAVMYKGAECARFSYLAALADSGNRARPV
jgi:hypothetical protein